MDKRCTKCGVTKPIGEFHLDRTKKDGRCSYCKPCNIKNGKQHHEAHYEEDNENKRKHYLENKDAYLVSMKQYAKTEKGKEAIRKAHQRNYEKYPEKYAARTAVGNAVRYGKIPPATSFVCSNCNDKQATGYHHWRGYEPKHHLDVIALCHQCHKSVEVE